ncbi:MAG: cyanophycinase [Terriglobales bacterium]|jgi:cyanophycinase-like exopeptidase
MKNRAICHKLLRLFSSLPVLLFLLCNPAHAEHYKYIRIGQKEDVKTEPSPGIAMMGGGADLDEAFRWMCQKANGGDFLILRAHGNAEYNSYVNGLCKLNSVATLIIPDRRAALDPAVADIIRHAAAIFIAGGDQARYVNFWKTTPVQDAINEAGTRKPIGGTSAGLAVLGEFSYGALNDPPDDSELNSQDALLNPYLPRVTLVRDFLKIPVLDTTITDSHFAKRDRMGRTLVFLARLMEDGWSKNPREVAVDEKSAVLVEPDGRATIVGQGKGAYFLSPTQHPRTCARNVPLTFHDVAVYKASTGSHFNLTTWTGDGGVSYTLSVDQGVVHSSQADHSIY